MVFGRNVRPAQTSGLFMPQQSGSLPMSVSTTQTTGINISEIMNLMLPMMIVGMMMKMMTGAMGSVGGKKKGETSAMGNPGNPGVSPKKGVIGKKIRGQDTIVAKDQNWYWNTEYKVYNSEKTYEQLRWEDLEPLQKEF